MLGRLEIFFKKIVKNNILLFIFANYLIYKYKITTSAHYEILNLIKKKNPYIIDIGGNTGESIKKFLKIKPFAKIKSFEPNIQSYKKLCENFKDQKNVKINNCALGFTNLKRKIGWGGDQNKSIFYIYTPYIYNFKFWSWSSIRLGDLKKNLKFHCPNIYKNFSFIKKRILLKNLDDFNLKSDLIKIDVEGFELEVISSGIQTLRKNYILLIEINKNKNKIKKKLNELGYEMLETRGKYDNNYCFINKKNIC